MTTSVAGAGVGGGVWVGWIATLKLSSGQQLRLEANSAARDGGGLALVDLARITVEAETCSADCVGKRLDGACDPACVSKGPPARTCSESRR